MALPAAARMVVVVVGGGGDDDAVGGQDRKHAAAEDAGDAVVAVVLDGGLLAVCTVGVDAVGDAPVGCIVAVDYGMGGFVLCSCLGAFPRALPPSCLALDHGHDPFYFLQSLIPSAPCSKEALEEDVCVVYLVDEEGLHVLV